MKPPCLRWPPHAFLFAMACTFLPMASPPAFADADADMAEMQKQLNQETMSSGFHVEDTARIDSYIQDAMKKNLQPKQNPPAGWQPGYTCASYYRRYAYSYNGYRDCLYYHRYYGRYW